MGMRRCQSVRQLPKDKDPVLEFISRLTLPTDFSEDDRSHFASLLPEPKGDNRENGPSCLTANI